MNNGHTPGPWHAAKSADGEHYNVRRSPGDHLNLAIVKPLLPSEGGAEATEANARLIETAPELADALADVRELLLVLNAEGDPNRDRAWAEEALPEVLERASEALEEAAGPDWWKHLGEL